LGQRGLNDRPGRRDGVVEDLCVGDATPSFSSGDPKRMKKKRGCIGVAERSGRTATVQFGYHGEHLGIVLAHFGFERFEGVDQVPVTGRLKRGCGYPHTAMIPEKPLQDRHITQSRTM
jgi:hypothetical protein